jgi:hypothetical protein
MIVCDNTVNSSSSHQASISKSFQVPDYYFPMIDFGNLELVGNLNAGRKTAIIIKTIHNSTVLQNNTFIPTDKFTMLLEPNTKEIECTIEFEYTGSNPQDIQSLLFASVQFIWQAQGAGDSIV